MGKQMTEKELQSAIISNLSRFYGVGAIKEATKTQLYKAVAMTARDILLEKRRAFNKTFKQHELKRVYYLSMEFLVGRSLKNNVFNLNIEQLLTKILGQHNINLDDLYECEPDAGLGNGGLGRLAACYLDSLASLGYPAMGHSLRYEYGLFQQKLVDGWQTELPDNWLPGGEVWLVQRPDKVCSIKFGGTLKEQWQQDRLVVNHYDYTEVEAVPYDMMVSGYNSEAVSVLRLWAARSKKDFDMKLFTQGDYMRAVSMDTQAEMITKVLYPTDDHEQGKSLRLKQQYLLVSAALQSILHDHLSKYKTLDNFSDLAAIHINDTHPSLCIPELLRLLLDEHGYEWDHAWKIVTNTCAYTNHTILSEALETWPEDMISRYLPRIHCLIEEINRRFCVDLWMKFGDWEKVSQMAIISHNQVRMANLSIVGSHYVNGVSALHSEIIRDSLFKDFFTLTPEKFTNVTNGIAHRRWLCQSNPRLSKLITDCIGNKFITEPSTLSEFARFADDSTVLKCMGEIKLQNKIEFSNYLFSKYDIVIDPSSRFDVHVKRLHEYKRQLLNALKIITLFNDLLENPNKDVAPQTFIFGAKAAPGYYMAKEIIKLIYCLSKEVSKYPRIKEKINIVFLENYCVTLAEKLIPAAEISQQISLAGKEASGTGNMKFMINGALTIGTMDGANVEMSEAVGLDNIFIFGMRKNEVEDLWAKGYNSTFFYLKNEKLRRTVDFLNDGFSGIAEYLLRGHNMADPYMCFADYNDYMRAHNDADSLYADKTAWNKKSLLNVAYAGRFAADRAVNEYASRIWNLKKTGKQ